MAVPDTWDEKRVRQLHDDLVSLYDPVERETEHGSDPDADPGEGVRQLVTTILSQNVADENTRRAADSLFERNPDFAAIEAADHVSAARPADPSRSYLLQRARPGPCEPGL